MTEVAKRILANKALPSAEKLRRLATELDALDAMLKLQQTLIEQKQEVIDAALAVMTEEQRQEVYAKIRR